MRGDKIVRKGLAPPLAPYSPGMKAGNTIYVSGTLPMDEKGNLVGEGNVKIQTRHVLNSIKAVIESAGASMQDVVYNMIFIKDVAFYKELNEVYAEFFPDRPPARFCIIADLVKPEFLVEIASIAYIG